MEKITRLTICDRCGQEIKLLSNSNPEFLMIKLHIKKKWGVLDTNGNAGGVDETQVDLCKECTYKLNSFLSNLDPSTTQR